MSQTAQFRLRRRVVMLGAAALLLAGCSTAPRDNSPAPVGIRPVDLPEPQNLQEKPIDLAAQPSGDSGGMKSFEAQGDIRQLLNQIHNEQDAQKK
jgi:PBP1b-binding outer membrane lipoprotein LpoB